MLEPVLADDFVNLVPRGGIGATKANLIKNLRPRAGQAPPHLLETQDLRVYVSGDTAVAADVKPYTAEENGNVAHEDITHIFTKDHAVWKLKIARASNCLSD